MAYIFRSENLVGVNTLEGWQKSTQYGQNIIDSIVDPNEEEATKEITSIPSPFARIELVKTAFKNVSKKDKNGDYINLEGNTIFHKMVSDSLDVAQIFFEYAKHSDKIEIIPWDTKNDLQELLQSDNSSHCLLGQTYQLFIQQDGKHYNFDKLNRLYLLNYTGEEAPDELNIIGATSPATLFFCSANNLSYVSEHITFGQDRPFNEDYKPLYRRDFKFFEYILKFRKSIRNFSTLFPEVDAYLTGCFKNATEEQKTRLRNIDADMSIYDDITIGGRNGNPVEILGHPLHQQRNTVFVKSIPEISDFVIKSALFNEANPPLVLPIEQFTRRWKYVRDVWDMNTRVPYADGTPWRNRSLPDDGSKYPYLTISDFLEDYLVQMPHGMTKENRDQYFDGNIIDDKSFLLPVKKLFFEFFTVEQLHSKIGEQNAFEMKKNAGGIEVILRIPVKNEEFIEYRRIYFKDNKPDIARNHGAIIEHDFAIAMLPVVQFSKSERAFYRIGLIHQFNDNCEYKICSKHNGEINETALDGYVRNEKDTRYPKCHVYAIKKQKLDYIRVVCGKASGLIVPEFNSKNNNDQYKFAIDFGTTNTHIEYSVNGATAKAFDVCVEDTQIQPFADYGRDYQLIFDAEFIPSLIGNNSKYNFPMRTALTEAKNTDWEQAVSSMVQAGFAFTYEKLLEYQYNRIITDLKWSNDKNNTKKVKCFIESLMLLLRNKVVLNGGDISKTEIVWFYPISMSENRFNNFKKVWEDAFTEYFGESNGRIHAMTESIAPYEYYKTRKDVNNIVTIDIGGGTTDVVMAKEKQVKNITSFRFAANAIFGDAYTDNNNGQQNGIIRQFKAPLLKVLEANNKTEQQLIQVFNQLDETNNSADLASFMFSLKDNVSDRGIASDVDFNQLLQLDETQKMSFIFFYSAIIYHVAHIMKLQGIQMPRHIAFSGNGSKVISILSPNEKTLRKYTIKIFELIYGEEYDKDGLTLIYNQEQPKEATCKGGIICKSYQDYEDIRDVKLVLDSSTYNGFIPATFNYQAINNDYIKNTVQQVEKFIKFVFDLNEIFNFKDHFGLNAESLKIAQEVCTKDLETFAKNGLAHRLEEAGENDPVEETLFFYPLIGMLNTLADEIAKANNF